MVRLDDQDDAKDDAKVVDDDDDDTPYSMPLYLNKSSTETLSTYWAQCARLTENQPEVCKYQKYYAKLINRVGGGKTEPHRIPIVNAQYEFERARAFARVWCVSICVCQ